MVTPTIHINGTSQRELLDQLEKGFLALLDAAEIMRQGAPHMRDYYVQENGDARFEQARRDHWDRIDRVVEVGRELQELALQIQMENQ